MIGLGHFVIRDDGIVGFSKALLVDKGEMADIEKSFDLPAGRGLDGDAVWEYRHVVRIFKFLHFRQWKRAIVHEANPHQAIAFLSLVDVEAQARRDCTVGMCWDAGASAFRVVAQTVVFTDNLVAFDMAEAERNSAVVADISRGNYGAVGDAVEKYAFVEKARRTRLVCYLARKSNWVPVWRQRPPVLISEGASARKSHRCRRICRQLRGRNEGVWERHVRL